MNPDRQRIVIAEACGFTMHKAPGCEWRIKELPDYLRDLNAMHAAVCTLDAKQVRWYRNHLIELTTTNEAIDASAAERAQAFLQAISKWD